MIISPITCRIDRHAVLTASFSGELATCWALLSSRELWGVGQAQPDVETDEAQRPGEQERDAPAVALHRTRGQQRLQQRHRHRADQEPEHPGPHHERNGQATPLVGRELGEIHRATPVFAAGGEALQAAQEQQQQWGGDTDRLVGRQQADGQRRGGHQQDDEGQHPLPRDPVAQGPNTNPPSGRMKNAAAKIAKVFSRAAVSFPEGKKLAAMNVARKP